PCMVDSNERVGPGRAPLTTWTQSLTGAPLSPVVTSIGTTPFSPGGTTSDPIMNASPTCLSGIGRRLELVIGGLAPSERALHSPHHHEGVALGDAVLLRQPAGDELTNLFVRREEPHRHHVVPPGGLVHVAQFLHRSQVGG